MERRILPQATRSQLALRVAQEQLHVQQVLRAPGGSLVRAQLRPPDHLDRLVPVLRLHASRLGGVELDPVDRSDDVDAVW